MKKLLNAKISPDILEFFLLLRDQLAGLRLKAFLLFGQTLEFLAYLSGNILLHGF